ncbi:hypothetical protein MK805_04900 [Shimazuella sp. AN120528]|uniref:hypothetical protein n=1 Tax=Shimazuella soli TaxID=1892854 RepID=UPI001F114B35|nr:hypothetical protein [Shimazuella soli]MCH5584307.1 hypothetical protein [Shimazuella soli]
MSKTIWIVSIATCAALYYFPNQDNFWAYISVPYYLSVCGLIVALFLSTQNIYQLINDMMLMNSTLQKTFVLLFYVCILAILFLFLPAHTTIFFFLFVMYQWREWSEYRGILLLRKEQLNKEK